MRIKTESVEKNTHFGIAEFLQSVPFISCKDYLMTSVVFFETKKNYTFIFISYLTFFHVFKLNSSSWKV